MRWFSKMIFDGGASDLKKHVKSKDCFFKILNIVKSFTKNHSAFRFANKGSILIEFAVCMPVLIILLYYINDLSKLKRYYDQTEFVAQQMVNILQNISQNREGDEKKITMNDMKYAFTLACQSIYPGTTMFYQNQGYAFVHNPIMKLYYVKGLIDNKASCIWGIGLDTHVSSCISPKTIYSSQVTSDHKGSTVRYKTKVMPKEIYPTLEIDPGTEKMILEIAILRDPSYKTIDGEIKTDKQAFGFFLANPNKRISGQWSYFYYSVQIFTPAPGLFDETPPK